MFELEIKELLSSTHKEGDSKAVWRYIGSCHNDGTLLRPDHLVYMLEQVSQQEFQLLHSHQQQLILGVE